MHEGAELAHDLGQVPALQQRRAELQREPMKGEHGSGTITAHLEGDAEHGEHHVSQSQVGDVEVCHGLE